MSALTVPSKQCPICKSRAHFKFKLRGFNLYQCLTCLHQFFSPHPSKIRKIYEKEKYYRDSQKFPSFSKQDHRNFPQCKTFTSRLSEIRSLLDLKQPKILDVGCGAGLFVKICNQQKIKATGIDFSKTAIRLAKKLKSNCYHQDFLKDMADSCFDVITMFDVLEHLVNPSAFLKKAHSALKKKGVLILTTPKGDSFACKIFKKRWHLYTPPLHLQIFSSLSVRLLLEKQGFKVLKIKNQGQWTNLGYMVSKMISIYNLKTAFIEKLLHQANLHRLNLYCNLFDVITIFAQKE